MGPNKPYLYTPGTVYLSILLALDYDRQSWITSSDGSALIYKLDSEGVPQNPMGRTGLRGRGSLPRWGPNHYVHAIITRFQKAREAFLSTKGLEFVVMWTERRFQLSIPGGFVAGEHRYEVIKSMFKPQFTGNSVWVDSNSVIKFFRDCVIAKIDLSESSESFPSILDHEESLKVVCDIVHKGYMDDPSNTDQAWKEVELWHIHFDEAENVSEKLQTSMGWRAYYRRCILQAASGTSSSSSRYSKKDESNYFMKREFHSYTYNNQPYLFSKLDFNLPMFRNI
ncbi:protein ced-11 [Trichonephila inaurata madagascariensis]|uniref:Protein ced-11 n=1 Tax=Trichonephila inaurata madagascariensis TaxID=2747483 RepID=A0A8X7CA32_9ARAC|nr:protein ced-11 [Trichonephila inaurata madagascariensis]